MVHIRLQCVPEILVADGTFQNSHNNHWHLTICPTVTPRFVFWRRSKLCQVHVRRWQCASRCQVFPSQMLLSGPNRWKSRGARSGLKGGRSITSQLDRRSQLHVQLAACGPVISISLGTSKKLLASKRYATEPLKFIACKQSGPCTGYKGIWGAQVYLNSCLISKLDELMVSFTFHLLYPRGKRHSWPLNRMPDVLQSLSERFEGVMNFLSLLGIKPKVVERPACNLVISSRIQITNNC